VQTQIPSREDGTKNLGGDERRGGGYLRERGGETADSWEASNLDEKFTEVGTSDTPLGTTDSFASNGGVRAGEEKYGICYERKNTLLDNAVGNGA